MREDIRRAVIATAWKKLKGQNPTNLYSYETGRHTAMGGGYDYEANAHYSDSYHYGTATHFSVTMNGAGFSGFDHESGSHFSGSINGNAITFYDGCRHITYTA